MISNLSLDIEILHIEIDLNMLFLIFIEYQICPVSNSLDYPIHGFS